MGASADTIVGLATAPGRGAVAIVRVSGPAAAPLAGPLMRGLPRPREAALRTLRGPDGSMLDRALVLWFPGPASFTGEDVVELHTHGGRIVPARVIRVLLEAGARLAEPGEFTRRAFLAGRIGLEQAEAINDLIQAESEAFAALASAQLHGGLRARITALRGELVDLLAQLQAELDFPEEDVETLDDAALRGRVDGVAGQVAGLAASFARGRLLREGIRVALVGRPNVGKSSLLNALLGFERALVTAEPGTTRDVLEEAFAYRGMRYVLLDTAGRRASGSLAEQAGVARGLAAAGDAQVRLLVVEAGREPGADEQEWLAGLDPTRDLLVRSKADLGGTAAALRPTGFEGGVCVTAALRGEGLRELMEAIHERALGLLPPAGPGEVVVTELRHRQALDEAGSRLAAFLEARARGLPPDLALLEVRAATHALASILGEVGVDEILDTIFRRFCLGK